MIELELMLRLDDISDQVGSVKYITMGYWQIRVVDS